MQTSSHEALAAVVLGMQTSSQEAVVDICTGAYDQLPTGFDHDSTVPCTQVTPKKRPAEDVVIGPPAKRRLAHRCPKIMEWALLLRTAVQECVRLGRTKDEHGSAEVNISLSPIHKQSTVAEGLACEDKARYWNE